MNCCFMCSPFKQMESARSEVSSSMAEYLEKEKICQEICKTITESVESTEQPIPNTMSKITLLPDINTDDIEGILHQISELLIPQGADNSQCSDLNGLNDSRSVEEILKEAENIVRASTPYFEKRSNASSISQCSWSSLKQLKPPRRSKSVDKNEKLNSVVNFNENVNIGVEIKTIESVSLDHEKTNILCNGDEEEVNDSPNNVPSAETFCPNNVPHSETSSSTSVLPVESPNPTEPEKSPKNIAHGETFDLNEVHKTEHYNDKDNANLGKAVKNDKTLELSVHNKLSLSDLATPVNNATFTLTRPMTLPSRPRSLNNLDKGDVFQLTDYDMTNLKVTYEEKFVELQKHISVLNTKLNKYETEIKCNENEQCKHKERIIQLEEELKCKEQLISGYQRENQRLCSEAVEAKDAWNETETKLVQRAQHLERQLKNALDMNNNESNTLRRKLKDAQENIVRLELQLDSYKTENIRIETTNEELTVDVTRLRCEMEEYRKDIEDWANRDKEKLSIMENNAVLQGKLSQANTEVTKKQTEIVRLNGEVGRLRGELERVRLGSVINHPSEMLNITISQLQSALSLERDNNKAIMKEKDFFEKENMDLKRQVKELESILKRRAKSGTGIPFMSEMSILSPSEFKLKESLEHKNKELEQQLSENETQLALSQKHFSEMQSKYEQTIAELKQKIKKLEQDKHNLKETSDLQVPKTVRRPNSLSSSGIGSAREDAHLLATIRGLKMELATRDKDIIRLNKELDDSKKTNRRLQKEREKALNTNIKCRGNSVKDVEKHSALSVSADSGTSSKNYNPILFDEDQDTLLFLRNENKTLRDEIKRLEQDLISLHNKRIQDLSDLQQEHDSEIAHLLREHAAKHSSSTVSHLQGQLYTQQMVISHLKQQIKDLESRTEEIPVLKAERDQLETTLMEANKKIARLHDLASPESVQYSGLLEKLEFLERRHEVREQKLQSIVRDLIARQGQGGLCGSTCRDKLINKNREICYYRAEMDRILDTLAEFRWSK